MTPEQIEAIADLADFRHYPPAENSRGAKCYLCLLPVSAHAGVGVLGGKNGAVYAATLHHGCASEVARYQDRQRARRTNGAS